MNFKILIHMETNVNLLVNRRKHNPDFNSLPVVFEKCFLKRKPLFYDLEITFPDGSVKPYYWRVNHRSLAILKSRLIAKSYLYYRSRGAFVNVIPVFEVISDTSFFPMDDSGHPCMCDLISDEMESALFDSEVCHE